MRLLNRPPSYSSELEQKSEKSSSKANQVESVPEYQKRECSHDADSTPALNEHLQDTRTQACLRDLRDILSGLINDDDDKASANRPCLKCAAASTMSTLFKYAGEMREAKRSGEWSKAEVKTMKKELKAVIKGWKRGHWPALKKDWKQKP